MRLPDAIRIAAAAHEGQVDKLGKPYISHPMAVMRALAAAGADERVLVVAVLHDVLEDTTATLGALLAQGLDDEQAQALVAVTRQQGETYAAFVLRAAGDPIGRLVKVADIHHNLSPERRAGLTPSHERRYLRALEILEKS